jgi:group II intron reverse transcriptase/maturase
MAKGDRYVGKRDKEDSEMLEQTNKTLAIYRERGKQGKRLERVYRQLFKQELYELAYAETYANSGATTKGSEGSSYDGMSMEVIDKIIGKVRKEQYKWKPVRRVYIPKSDGSKRPLGVLERDDKLLQTATKILLEAYYEPKFSNRSHGFRPNRSCATALIQMCQKHADTNWFIEGDIKGCFDNIDHDTLLGIMKEDVEDGRLISLIQKMLKAGYMENWQKHYTHSGSPQGGTISPLLANIYLNKLDEWVEKELLPEYNRRLNPRGRRRNPEYQRLAKIKHKAKKKGDWNAYKEAGRKRRNMPSVIINDDGYRKLEYVRYADDFLLSFSGPKKEAEKIKERLGEFLRDELKLEMSQEKTLITNARSGRAKFLGYEVSIFPQQESSRCDGKLRLRVPKEVITRAIRKYSKNGKPVHLPARIIEQDAEIIWRYQAEFRGLVEYYRMAHNIHALSKVGWTSKTSLMKTLARKHKTTVGKISKKYGAEVVENGKKWKVIQAIVEIEGKKPYIATYGMVSLTRDPLPVSLPDNIIRPHTKTRSEIIERLRSVECQMCGEIGKVQFHHIRKLKDMHKPGRKRKTLWEQRMIAIRRKTLACCHTCHQAIDNGEYLKKWAIWKDTLESRVQ